jgi:hypothetical protein
LPDQGTARQASLCHTCTFVREVTGRLGQTYLMCRNEAIPAKYLPQPVLQCLGYAPACAIEKTESGD